MSRYFRRFQIAGLIRGIGVVLGGIFAFLDSYAWVPTRMPDGQAVSWMRASPSAVFKMDFVGNPTNRSGLSGDAFRTAVVRGLQRWEKAAGGAMDFDYWQGTDSAVYDTDVDYDGISSIHFASAAPRDSVLPANVLGMTQVWYNTDTGEILETDIVLNDLQAAFTTDPTDTTGYGNGRPSTIYEGTQLVYIENVLTHELGHALGLSHSGGLQSTMLFVESPEQAHLSCDEQIAIRALYPTASDSKKRGELAGTVAGPDGRGVFGAQVTAISKVRGVSMASVLTGPDGTFELGALEPGDYFILAEPFFGGAAALTDFYGTMDTQVCSGGQSDFVRTGLMANGTSHDLQSIKVRAGKTASVGVLTVACMAMSKADKNSAGVIDPAGDSADDGFGTMDRLAWGEERVYSVGLPGTDGALRVHALAYSLYSPVKPVLALLDSSGNEVKDSGVQVKNPVYSGDSGYQNFDGELFAVGLDPTTAYYVRVRGSYVDSFKVPGGPDAVDSSPFFVLSVSKGSTSPALASELTDDARCSMSDSFARYSSPKSSPQRESTSQSTGGCSPAAHASEGRAKAQTPSMPEFLSGYLPLLVAVVLGRNFRRRKVAGA
jgi:hypothetical protein